MSAASVGGFLKRYHKQIGEGVFGGLTGAGVSVSLARKGGEGRESTVASGISGALAGAALLATPAGLMRAARLNRAMTKFKGTDVRYTSFVDDIVGKEGRLGTLTEDLAATSKQDHLEQIYSGLRKGQMVGGGHLPGSLSALSGRISGLGKKQTQLRKGVSAAGRDVRNIEKRIKKRSGQLGKEERRYSDEVAQYNINTFQMDPRMAHRQARNQARTRFSGIRRTVLGKPIRDYSKPGLLPSQAGYKPMSRADQAKRTFGASEAQTGKPIFTIPSRRGKAPAKPSFEPYWGDPRSRSMPATVTRPGHIKDIQANQALGEKLDAARSRLSTIGKKQQSARSLHADYKKIERNVQGTYGGMVDEKRSIPDQLKKLRQEQTEYLSKQRSDVGEKIYGSWFGLGG